LVRLCTGSFEDLKNTEGEKIKSKTGGHNVRLFC
jgi:hypothetical protein